MVCCMHICVISMQAHKLELQQQVAEKQAAAEALQAEHARLVARNSMLEKVLDTQQASVNILQGNGQVQSRLRSVTSTQQSTKHLVQAHKYLLCHTVKTLLYHDVGQI